MQLRVRGTVLIADGRGAAGLVVCAFDRDLRRRELLGQAITDAAGRYEIRYSLKRYARAESGSADLQIAVFASTDSKCLLVESGVVFNAGADATIDLMIADSSQRRSEFEIYIDRLAPLLKGQADDDKDLAFGELTEADIEFLAAEAGVERASIEALREAHRVAREFIPQAFPACFGWFRKGINATVEAVRATSTGELRRLLVEAIDEGICPAAMRDGIEELLDSIGQPERSEVRRVLGAIGLEADQVRAVAAQLDSVEAVDEITLRALTQSGTLEPVHVDRLGLAASLLRLTNGGEALVEAALGRPLESLGGRSPTRSEDLARMTVDEWTGLLKEGAAPVAEGSTVEEFAKTISEESAGAYPTVALMQRALRKDSNPDAPLALLAARNEELDLLALDLTEGSADRAKLDRGTLSEEQAATAIGQLRTMQRMLSIGGHPTIAQKLIESGFRHATRVALATQADLVEKAGLDQQEAARVHERAYTNGLAAVHAWMAVRDAQTDRQMISGIGMSMSAATAADRQIARWADMFGSADACDCDHCQSVLGPGA